VKPAADLPRHIHCVGIGGGGLSALAGLLAERGHVVSGSDAAPTFRAEPLRARGIDARHGHAALQVGPAELLVRSAAVPDDNPEIAEARRRDLPVLKYAEALGRLMAARRGIAVAGTHGKTTTTALVAHLLRAAGRDPGWLVGGVPLSLPAAASWGAGEHFVAEACEYDLSFLQLDFEVAVINSVAPDHLDCFGDERGVQAAFERFAGRVPAHGVLVLGTDVPSSLPFPVPAGARILRAGRDLRLASLREEEHGFAGAVEGPAGRGEFRLPLLGRHNVDHLLAALLVLVACGVPVEECVEHAAGFGGVGRRLQDLGESETSRARGVARHVRIVDDFAHHPDALRAAAAAVRARWPGRRVVAVFQPHQVSRTADFLSGFAEALRCFDEALLCDIFVARDREPQRADELIEALAALTGRGTTRVGPARACDAAVAARLRERDVCVVMGAGDVDGLAARLAGAPAGP
jgi:UDP-N-acetylmuramate--alanine ligase